MLENNNNNFSASSKRTVLVGSQKNILTRAFFAAGLIFLAVFAIGITTWLMVDRQGVLKAEIAAWENSGYSFNTESEAFSKIMGVFAVGAILSVASMILVIVWSFRFHKSSMTFASVVLGAYILSQGIGFGIMFTLFQFEEILYAFAIGGGIFLACSVVGMIIKDASGLLPWIRWMFFIVIAASIVEITLYFLGIFSSTLYLAVTLGSTIVSALYIVYIVWRLRKMAEWESAGGEIDPAMKMRLTLFFGFILASSLINLIWQMLRLIQYFKN